jgi:F0F1-type ATP synthase alpha subunit
MIAAVLVPVPVLAQGQSLNQLLAQAQKQLATVNNDKAKLIASDQQLLTDATTLLQLDQSGTKTQFQLNGLHHRLDKDVQKVQNKSNSLRKAQAALNKTANELLRRFGTNFGF